MFGVPVPYRDALLYCRAIKSATIYVFEFTLCAIRRCGYDTSVYTYAAASISKGLLTFPISSMWMFVV